MSITGWGIFGLSWLGDSQLAVFSTIIVSVWQSLGFYIPIYVAGMQGVPTELNESADLDGAGAVRRFFLNYYPADHAVHFLLHVPFCCQFLKNV